MCDRFALDAETEELIREFVAQGGRLGDWRPGWRPSYSIAPTDVAPVVRERIGDGQVNREVVPARWEGPRSVSDPAGAPLVNVDLHDLEDARWTDAFSRSRCIVPMNGYFEWTGPVDDRTPRFIHGEGFLAAAGLTWTSEVDGERSRTFIVITREARDASGGLHDRMPAFLTRDLWDEWLAPAPLTLEHDAAVSERNRRRMVDKLHTASNTIAATLRADLVSRRINSAHEIADPSDPALIEPTR